MNLDKQTNTNDYEEQMKEMQRIINEYKNSEIKYKTYKLTCVTILQIVIILSGLAIAWRNKSVCPLIWAGIGCVMIYDFGDK